MQISEKNADFTFGFWERAVETLNFLVPGIDLLCSSVDFFLILRWMQAIYHLILRWNQAIYHLLFTVTGMGEFIDPVYNVGTLLDRGQERIQFRQKVLK
ncbi:MAG: hypothetical protein IH935_05060 [Acidobacteria bacterium]|nr:hypothetical protein [Acidobacteriota bacterium]